GGFGRVGLLALGGRLGSTVGLLGVVVAILVVVVAILVVAILVAEVLELDLFLQALHDPAAAPLEGEVVELVDLAELVAHHLELVLVDVDDDLVLRGHHRGRGLGLRRGPLAPLAALAPRPTTAASTTTSATTAVALVAALVLGVLVVPLVALAGLDGVVVGRGLATLVVAL